MKSFVCGICLFLFLSLSIVAQTGYQKAVNEFVKAHSFKHAGISVSLIDVKTGKLLASADPYRSLTPASSLKVITTSSALAILGKDYRFKTELQFDGEINEAGVLNGDIYIKGYGDPTLGSDHFGDPPDLDELMDIFVKEIKKLGVKKVNGRIIGDASVFDTSVNGRSWLWEDLGNYYASGAWGLNIRENRFHLDFLQTSKMGGQPQIKEVDPYIPNLMLINEVKSAEANSGDNAYIFGAPYGYTRFIRGTIPVGKGRFTIKGSIPDPPFFAAYYLSRQLEEQGISVDQPASSLFELERTEKRKDSPKRHVFYTHFSPMLKEIVEEANMKSVNLYCEAMLKAIGWEKNQEGSTVSGLEVIRQYWSAKGFKTTGFFMEDGSGLSMRNAISSYQMAQILQLLAGDAASFDHFFTSLPEAGKSGTLKYMFRGSSAVGKLRAKSGGMERVRSYTGYISNAKSDRLLAFSMIVNNFEGESSEVRNKMQQLMIAFCK